MKVHPVVGAEIVEQVQFPYPVAPIVRAHHEKWDGTGYPFGLKGGAIPLGARILTAVDCLDALTSDREYRKAVSYDDAMEQIRADSGQTFDPKVVEALNRRYRDLERLAKVLPQGHGLAAQVDSDSARRWGAGTPGAGFDLCSDALVAPDKPLDFLSLISAAGSEDRFLVEITESLGASLDLDETLTRVEKILKAGDPT